MVVSNFLCLDDSCGCKCSKDFDRKSVILTIQNIDSF